VPGDQRGSDAALHINKFSSGCKSAFVTLILIPQPSRFGKPEHATAELIVSTIL